MTDKKRLLLNAHITKAIGQLVERTGFTERQVLLAMVTNAAVRLESMDGTAGAYNTLCATAAAVMATAPPDTPVVKH